jgi:hypothetical protein
MSNHLGQLIEALRAADQSLIAPFGFAEPMSYRGYYEDLAFQPAKNVSVASMLAHAESALGATFEGYKGGDFVMHEWTTCWIAGYSESGGDAIGPTLIAYLTGSTP